MNNPYTPPQAELRAPQHQASHYGGIRRLPYFLWNLGVVVGAFIIGMSIGMSSFSRASQSGDADSVFASIGAFTIVLIVLLIVGGLVLAAYRFKNQGSSPWMCLLQFIPFVNIWVGWRLIACQEGYADQGSLDKAGKIITAVYIVLMIASFAVQFMAPTEPTPGLYDY